jgi:hypothetical protein
MDLIDVIEPELSNAPSRGVKDGAPQAPEPPPETQRRHRELDRETLLAVLLAVAAALIAAGALMIAVPLGLVVAGFCLVGWTVVVFVDVG